MTTASPSDNATIDPLRPSPYWIRSQRPLQGMFFLLPLILLYELGTVIYATDQANGVTRYIYARSLLSDFFELLGVTGYYLPGLIVVVLLLSWHMVRRDPWRFELRLYAMMWAESIVLALPLFVYALILFREPLTGMTQGVADGLGSLDFLGQTVASARPASGQDGWQAQLVFSIGAGIYEELLFRLIGIALLHMVLVDVLALPEHFGATGAIVLSALVFALYHFSEDNPFTPSKCLFYTGAGVYFAAVYVLRGFGIVAGTHAAYDVIVVMLQQSSNTS